jgi:uncharacterized membrane protein
MQAWRWFLAQLTRRLWVRASIYAGVGVAAALLAAVFSSFVPKSLAEPFGGGTVDGLLNVLASSLLTVATFSAAAMLTAYTSVAQSVTPRASALITSDTRAQTALASFVGGFLYSVVAFSALGTGYYAHGGRAILFVTTLAMMVWISITLLRWLDQLSGLARMGKAIEKVEDATSRAIRGPFGPALSPAAWETPPPTAQPVTAGKVGYIRNVDLGALRKLARRKALVIWVLAPPGVFVHQERPLASVETDRPLTAALERRIRAAFDVSGSRTFDQDPRFGFVVLGEIASRALSPAVNDPGTAIDIIGTAVRLLTLWRNILEARGPAAVVDVRLAPVVYADLLEDVFRPVATDGASSFAVALRLQKAFAALYAEAGTGSGLRDALLVAAGEAADRARAGLSADIDLNRVLTVHQQITSVPVLEAKEATR